VRSVESGCRRLILFARYPRLGAVKTRLGVKLGDEAALGFHKRSLRHLLKRLSTIAAERYLYVAGCNALEAGNLARELDEASGFQVCLQSEGDLGERLVQAVHDVWKEGDRAVFLGSDAPTVPTAYVEEAFRALDYLPVVLGPSTDGGYYLIGLDRPRDHLFNVDWGTDRVLAQTVLQLEPGGFALLPEWFDVDEAADLERLRAGVESWE
jgi:uncharacterized protein